MSHVVHIISPQQFNEGLRQDKVIVDFSASWCGPCKQIAPVFDKLSVERRDILFLKVDVDDVEEVAAEYDVTAMPTFIAFKNGIEISRIVGANEDKIREIIQQLDTVTVTYQ